MAKNKGRNLKNPFEKEKEYSLFDDEIISEAMKKSGLDKEDPKDRLQLLRVIEMMKEEYDKDPEGFLDYMTSLYDDMDEENPYPVTEFPITENEWTLTHPFQLKCGSDKFYADVANEILKGFSILNIDPTLPKGVLRISAKSAAAYLEDIISETGVWNAVRKMYQKRYNRQLPFFDVNPEDYFDDDLNIEDLKLLVWQAFNMCGKYYERTFSPLSVAVEKMAAIAYDILIDRFEEAKPAKRIKDRITKIFKEGDYFELRTLGLWLTADNPLTAAPFMRRWMQENALHTLDYSLKKGGLEGVDTETAYYFEEARLGWKRYMSLNGCGSNELLAEIAKQMGFKEISDKLMTIKEIPFDTYSIDSANGKDVSITNEVGHTLTISKNTFRSGIDWKNVKSVSCQIYRFGDSYVGNGVTTFSEYAPEWANETSKDTKLSKKIDVPINNDPFIQRCKEVVAKNRGRRIYYCGSIKEIQDIMGEDMRPLVYDPETKETIEKVDENINLLLMLSSTDGPILIDGYCDIFKDPKNPYYLGRDIPEKDMGGYNFICNVSLPDDVIDYIVERKMLPNAYMYASQGKRVGKRLVQDNLGFLMRFNRVTGYRYPDEYDLPDFDDYDDEKDE